LQSIEIIPAVDSIEPGNRAIEGAHAVPNIVLPTTSATSTPQIKDGALFRGKTSRSV
jgi:hypothetical protein